MNKKIVLGIAAVLILALAGMGIYRQMGKKQEKEVIKIGAILPLTGNASAIGEYSRRGLDYAVKEQNSKGGILGRSIELQIDDSKGDPKEGGLIMQRIINLGKKPLLIYSQISGVTLSIKKVSETNKVLLVGCVGTDELLENSKFTYRNFISPDRVGREIAKFVLDSLKMENIGIYYINNVFGKSYESAVLKCCSKIGVGVKFNVPYEENAKDYKNLIAKEEIKDIRCIYIAGVGQSIGLMIKQLRDSGYKGIIIGDANMPNPSAISIAKKYMYNTYYLDFHFDAETPEAKYFINKFKSFYGDSPENFAIVAYLSLKFIFNKMEEYGSFDSEKLNSILDDEQLVGPFGKISIENHDIIYPLKINLYNNK